MPVTTIESIGAWADPELGIDANPVYGFFTEKHHLVSRPLLAYSKSIETRADEQYRWVALGIGSIDTMTLGLR